MYGLQAMEMVGQDDDTSASVSEQLVRWLTFLGKWEAALLEDKDGCQLGSSDMEKH